IDTGPAQQAIERRRDDAQPAQSAEDQIALTDRPTETPSGVVPPDSTAGSADGPVRNTPPAFAPESTLSPDSGAETEPARSSATVPGTEPARSVASRPEIEAPRSSTSVPDTGSVSEVTPGPGSEPAVTSPPTAGSESALSPESSPGPEPAAPPPVAPVIDTGGVNILIMGVDARDNESIDVGVRPDSLAVLHLEDSGACRMLAIPRDSRAALPGYGQSKINHALAVGGIEYEMLVIEDYLGIELDHYGLIDFEGITQVVDSVGGITVDNPSPFEMDGQQFAQGQIRLDGEQALLYARFRGTSEGDFGRISKQQQVLRALLDEAITVNPVKVVPEMFSLLTDHFRTDYGVTDLVDLARTYRSSCTSTSIETQTIPGDVRTLPDDMMQMDLSFVVSDPAVVQQNVEWLIGNDNAALADPSAWHGQPGLLSA
ncbi:MAG: LCP family protein, partial [Chloroflexota bacterium]|nr:LCP family protein [Chloroflexota bacterium]